MPLLHLESLVFRPSKFHQRSRCAESLKLSGVEEKAEIRDKIVIPPPGQDEEMASLTLHSLTRKSSRRTKTAAAQQAALQAQAEMNAASRTPLQKLPPLLPPHRRRLHPLHPRHRLHPLHPLHPLHQLLQPLQPLRPLPHRPLRQQPKLRSPPRHLLPSPLPSPLSSPLPSRLPPLLLPPLLILLPPPTLLPPLLLASRRRPRQALRLPFWRRDRWGGSLILKISLSVYVF